MSDQPPKYYQPWEHPLLPAEASHPTEFNKVRVWRDGKTEIVDPNDVKEPFDNVYWQPVDAASSRGHIN